MLTSDMIGVLSAAKDDGWVMEPGAKTLLGLAEIDVTRFVFTRDLGEATAFARATGYPLVAKVVSPRIIHKSDVGGVAAGIADDGELTRAFERLSRIEGATGVIVEEMVQGMELIAGAKLDDQFGPVILLGAGGTAVEIYKDVTLRMAPLTREDAGSMMASLRARPLYEGYRGSEPVNEEALYSMLLRFSALVMDLGERIESIDLNPVICSKERCIVADARIILSR